MKFKVFLASLFLLCAQSSLAADVSGRSWLGGGAGGVNCPEFVASMEKARSLRIGTLGYVQETQGFTMYLQGFRSGYNVATKDTCDLFAGEENDYPLLAWTENWCRTHSSSRFSDAVVALSVERFPKRQKVCAK
jgi:hypothetical protein